MSDPSRHWLSLYIVAQISKCRIKLETGTGIFEVHWHVQYFLVFKEVIVLYLEEISLTWRDFILIIIIIILFCIRDVTVVIEEEQYSIVEANIFATNRYGFSKTTSSYLEFGYYQMIKIVASVFDHCMEMNFVFQFFTSVFYIQNIVLKKNITFINQEANQLIQKPCKAYKELSGIVHFMC